MRILLLFPLTAMMAPAQDFEGEVVNSVTRAPIAGARVSGNPFNGGKMMVVRSDAGGHFRFPAVISEISQVAAVRAGFLSMSKPCCSKGTFRIELPPASVITGTIDDEEGFPVQGATVQAIREQFFYGQHRQQIAATAVTDDHGQYRLTDLPANAYWIRVIAFDLAQWDDRYIPMLYPGTLTADGANKVKVGTGEERGGVDVLMRRIEGVTISGRIVGKPADLKRMGPPNMEEKVSRWFSLADTLQADGSFNISHVPPGEYILFAQSDHSPPYFSGEIYATLRLRVGNVDQRGIVLEARTVQPVDLSGTIGSGDGGALPIMVIDVIGDKGEHQQTRSNADGSFLLTGLLPDHYQVDVRPTDEPPDGRRTHYPVSAVLGTEETLLDGLVIDSQPIGPLRITLSSRAIEINGRLLSGSGNPAAGVVLAFVSDGRNGQAYATTEDDGAFKATLRQTGDYHVYELNNVTGVAQWDDWEYFRAHANDFPLLRVAGSENAPLMLRAK